MRMLDDEIARARRIGTPCSIALIDLDWFKRINDAYGHPTGDEVLRTFAITVFANIRSIDRFGRYGGEEFLLVLPDTPDDGAAPHARPAARDHCRSRLERVLARHAGNDFRRRRHAAIRTRRRTHFSRAPTARFTQPRHEDATVSPAPDSTNSVPATKNPSRARNARTLQDRVMSSKPAATSENLLDELQTTLAHGTVARRVETLRRVTDLFINGAVDFSDEQIELFDDVFQCLMHHIETSAKALLANRLAPIEQRAAADHPHAGVRRSHRGCRLRCSSRSERLDDEALIETARSKSQAHLMAISTRRVLSGAVTDVLVLRGNDEVVQSTVNNPGAEFSERGFTRLVKRAEGDDDLATCVGLRPTIPRHLYLKLIAKASATVRARLEAANPQQAGDVPNAVREATQLRVRRRRP